MSHPSLPLRILDQVQAFQYVTVEKAPIYRAIVQVFSEARHHYVIELRPTDVFDRIRAAGLFVDLGPDETLDYFLGKLVEWGNLAAAHDTASVARLEDFYRKRLLYRLTEVGEVAHRAVARVEEVVGRTGALQASRLSRVRDALRDLAVATEPVRARDLLDDLHATFGTLTEQANRFIGELDRSVAATRIDEERFAAYKQALLAYISRFVDQLRLLADEIRSAIDALDIDTLLDLALPAAELPPSLEGRDPAAVWREEQLARWAGIRTWFIGDDGGGPTVERLADVAVDAVVGLTRSLGRLNGRRTRHVDRSADFRTLARWFSACDDDRSAHALWNAAFGLSSARHFHIAEEDEELTPSSTSWWDARPVEVPVRLRERGNTGSTGRAAAVADHAVTRQWLAAKRVEERKQLDAAIARFSGRGPLTFRDICTLAPAEFDLLLALLDQALVAPRAADGTRSTRTIDGRLIVRLHPPAAGDRDFVTITTRHGRLRCGNYQIEVSPAVGAILAKEAG